MRLSDLFDQLTDFESQIEGIVRIVGAISADIGELQIDNVQTDHRNVDSSSVFVALVGNQINSHAFIPDARHNGAKYVIGQLDATSIVEADLLVGNSRAIIGPMASVLEGFPSRKMSLVGITGTNGKTSVSYLYSAMVQEQKSHCFTMGTTGILLNGEKEADSQTTPDPLTLQNALANFLRDGVKYGAMEVSSHALDQFRVLGTWFSAVAFTNFSQDHLDYHKNMEAYFQAKARLFTSQYSKTAVVNIDDPKGPSIVEIARKNGVEVIEVSTSNEESNVYLRSTKSDLDGIEGEIKIRTIEGKISDYHFETSMIGDFNLENIAVAIGLAVANNLDIEQCVKTLTNARTVPGRLERPAIIRDYSVFVDYAHTPDALERVLKVVKPLCKKLIVVFGCGGDRDKSKRPIMGKIASSIANISIVTNDNPRSEEGAVIAQEIVGGASSQIQVILDRREAIEKAISMAEPGDAIVIAGKGHEKGQIFSDKIIDFSDMEVANEIMDGK